MLTIFTPTYNRESTLERLYKSLKNQTLKNFEWIIVDDGSTDNTKNLIESFIKEDEFSIVYKKVENGGKMRAINIGALLATKEFFFIVDSDDYLNEKAVEIIQEEIVTLPLDYAGLVFRKVEILDNGSPVKEKESFGEDQIDSTPINIFYKKKILGDKAEIIRTSIMREYPFPEIEGEKFVPEGYIWNQIGENYMFRYIDKGIYYYQYLEDGYTRKFSEIIKNNPKGMKLYYSYMIKTNIPLKNKIKFLIRLLQSICYERKKDRRNK
ncbi:MAG: glycosyltransferase family 2 protein [Cetobacterium sp.]|uniref:glycosyltransferase family 2 protein n=1 Tax=Cetobacterium sp. ZOR0034 TaxID=1339239 RepID=UPI00068DCE7A|nr:glycosyltransferase family A protein [Cetobacterium sp. ZOR0034]